MPYRNPLFYVTALSSLALLYAIAASRTHLQIAHFFCHGNIASGLIRKLWTIRTEFHFQALLLYVGTIVIFFFGLKPFSERRRFQRALSAVSLKNGEGFEPRVIDVREAGAHRTKVVICGNGVGFEKFDQRRGDLESSMGAVIENVQAGRNPRLVEITLAKRRVPQSCKYTDLVPSLNHPYSFLVGESVGGLVTQCIRDLPHLLIAGTSGKGKSIFFRQTLLGLAHTSPHLQLYLLDLKRGVEMKEFAQLPNVVVAKNEASAVKVLSQVKAEMDRRFEYLEKHGYKKIDPQRDGLDLVVVGVDEASVLYTKPSRGSPDADLIQDARHLTDQLAKLGRAAGIHVILATQKVTKETIDTKIQENIEGRVCFRTNTLQGSLTVLGNKMAYELPDLPGRAVWSKGSEFTEIQAPMIEDEEVDALCKMIQAEFNSGKRKNLQDILGNQTGSPPSMADPGVDVDPAIESQAA